MIQPTLVLLCLTLFAQFADFLDTTGEVYSEELVVTPLQQRYLLADFRFTFLRDSTVAVDQYATFPKSIAEIINHYHLEELHLVLTQGHWRVQQWGYPSAMVGPTGASIIAWFDHSQSNTSVNILWRDLVHTLSGMLCASFTQMHPTLTVEPEFAFQPQNTSKRSIDLGRTAILRYAVLPSENVCTENFTPWKKLLPCKMQSGISSLLNPLKLFSAHYHSLTIHVKKIDLTKLHLAITASSVVPVQSNLIDFVDLFGSKILGRCSVAASSDIFVNVEGAAEATFMPNYTSLQRLDNGKEVAKFEVSDYIKDNITSMNIRVRGLLAAPFVSSDCATLNIHSYVAGVGQQDGALVSQLSNLDATRDVSVTYSHVIPWYLQVYFHTLTIVCQKSTEAERILKPDFAHYSLGLSRQRPYYLELALTIPAQSVCKLSINFDRMLLRWTEYPPDAHHGFYVPAPVVAFSFGATNCSLAYELAGERSLAALIQGRGNAEKSMRIFGEAMLVRLPTPDFSMPYNVICLVCTVVALAFGPVHNLTTRVLVLKDPEELKKRALKARIATLRGKIIQFFVKKRVDTSAENTNTMALDNEKTK